MMADARKWGEAVFSGGIRRLEAEYQKTARRDAVLQAGGIRLALFGREFYLDENQLEKTWQPPCFFQQYEQDISAVMDRLRKEYP